MSFGIPVRNGLGIGLRASTALSTRGGAAPLTVSDVFSTYLYTGTSATQTITNSINISGNGGLVWIKPRTSGLGHNFFDTIRGPLMRMQSDNTDDNTSVANSLTGFTSSGFTLGSAGGVNNGGTSFASWTFRETPKFFDVVTYTGNGGDLTVNHSLGIQPGCIIIKKYSAIGDWLVSNRYNFGGAMLKLNTADASFAAGIIATSATFRVFGGAAGNSDSGATYVAYLWAHDPASDGLIQCGSYTGNSSAMGPVINLGWEPQWLMIKNTSGIGNWQIIDNMRGMPVSAADATLQANLTNVETLADYVSPTATGFQVVSISSEVNTLLSTYIYIAIRKAP